MVNLSLIFIPVNSIYLNTYKYLIIVMNNYLSSYILLVNGNLYCYTLVESMLL